MAKLLELDLPQQVQLILSFLSKPVSSFKYQYIHTSSLNFYSKSFYLPLSQSSDTKDPAAAAPLLSLNNHHPDTRFPACYIQRLILSQTSITMSSPLEIRNNLRRQLALLRDQIEGNIDICLTNPSVARHQERAVQLQADHMVSLLSFRCLLLIS